MKKVLIIAAALLAFAATASASNVPTPTATQIAGTTNVVLDVVSPCEDPNGQCSYTWVAFRVGGPAKGSQLGAGKTITVTLVAGQTYSFVVTKQIPCFPGSPRSCPSTNTVSLKVNPA